MIVSVALLAAASLGAPASAPYRVVRTDGAVVVLAAPPERKGRVLVGKLAADGLLVSLPVAEVDAAATERENRVPHVPAEPEVPAWAKGPRPTPALGSRVALKATREEAERTLASASGTAKGVSSPSEAESDRAEEPRPRRDTRPTDLSGRGEAHWRALAGRARDRLEEAEERLASASARREAVDRAGPGVSGYGVETWARHVLRLRDAEAEARREVERARAAIEDLREEARKAGAWPGWLRP